MLLVPKSCDAAHIPDFSITHEQGTVSAAELLLNHTQATFTCEQCLLRPLFKIKKKQNNKLSKQISKQIKKVISPLHFCITSVCDNLMLFNAQNVYFNLLQVKISTNISHI